MVKVGIKMINCLLLGTRDFNADDLMHIIIDMEDKGIEFPGDSDEEASNSKLTDGFYVQNVHAVGKQLFFGHK